MEVLKMPKCSIEMLTNLKRDTHTSHVHTLNFWGKFSLHRKFWTRAVSSDKGLSVGFLVLIASSGPRLGVPITPFLSQQRQVF
jgi:hypothetical protein